MTKIDQKQFDEMLKSHKEWLKSNIKGKRLNLSHKDISYLNMQGADMQWANMQEVNMQRADMQWANMQGANMQRANMRWANMQEADMQGADMRWANMQEADMQGADMQEANIQGADIDFSCWPLWCGSLNVITDKKQRKQIGYHLATLLDDDDPEEKIIKKVLKPYVNTFHRIPEVDKIR